MINYETLAQDIQEGPLAEACQPFVVSGYDIGIASLFNEQNYQALGRMTKSEFTLAILPATLALASKDAATQVKWDRILHLASGLETIDPSLPMVSSMFDLAVQDGLMTIEQRSSIGYKPASRAEVLFGLGVSVHHLDIAKALGRN